MTKTSIGLQDLRRRIYLKAKADQEWRFWGLYVHVCKPETLRDFFVDDPGSFGERHGKSYLTRRRRGGAGGGGGSLTGGAVLSAYRWA